MSKYLYLPHFLLPAGGAIAITKYEHGHVFRTGLLSNMWSLGQIGHCMPELLQTVCGCNTKNTNTKVFVFATLPATSRWRYYNNLIWGWSCVQDRTLITHVKFGADRTLYAWVTAGCLWLPSNIGTASFTQKLSDDAYFTQRLKLDLHIYIFVRPPRSHPSTKTLDLRNLTSQRP